MRAEKIMSMKKMTIRLWVLTFCCLSTGILLNAQTPLLNGTNLDYRAPFENINRVSGAARTGGSGIPEWPPAKVRIGYVVPSNRTPQANYKENLQFAIEMAQVWFRDNMEQNGFGPKTFIFETEEDSPRPKIHLVNVPETDSYLRGNSGGDLFDRTKFAAKNAGLTIDLGEKCGYLSPKHRYNFQMGVLSVGLPWAVVVVTETIRERLSWVAMSFHYSILNGCWIIPLMRVKLSPNWGLIHWFKMYLFLGLRRIHLVP